MKKSKKFILVFSAFVLVLTITIIGIFSFANRKPDRPVTNLEFWIGDNADAVDFSGYTEKYGLFGGREYYGTGYVPTVDENGMTINPEHCVIYTVTSYPDYSSNKKHITGIYITDPAIAFYGVSLHSSFQEFKSLMKKQGFKITGSNEAHCTAEKGKYSVTLTKDYIRIRADVSNILGIQF